MPYSRSFVVFCLNAEAQSPRLADGRSPCDRKSATGLWIDLRATPRPISAPCHALGTLETSPMLTLFGVGARLSDLLPTQTGGGMVVWGARGLEWL